MSLFLSTTSTSTKIKYIAGVMVLLEGLGRVFSNNSNIGIGVGITIAGAVIVWFGYKSAKVESMKNHVRYLNEKNDGRYTYYAKFGSDEYGIEINANTRTINLKSGKTSKSIEFDRVKSWRYSVEGISEVTAIPGTRSVMENASGLLQANAINNKKGRSAWENNGLYIYTDELSNPVWHIKIMPENTKPNFKSDKFWKSVINECQVWMNVMDKTINKS